VAALHRNAAAWLEDHGLVDEAVHHALAAVEADWAARLVEQHTQECFQRGEGATVDAGWRRYPPSCSVPGRG
jgi:LuxR family maltose regulon positive regulatory protein